MELTVLEQAQIANGHSLRIGSMVWPRPYFPTRAERAQLIKTYLPGWAIASAQTAGFIWTGMGSPEPWMLVRHPFPALSPLVRTDWPSSVRSPNRHRLELISGLLVTCPEDTAIEILLHEGNVDSATAQLLILTRDSVRDLRAASMARRAAPKVRDFTSKVLTKLSEYRSNYPDITR
jgi:hypothetical protein